MAGHVFYDPNKLDVDPRLVRDENQKRLDALPEAQRNMVITRVMTGVISWADVWQQSQTATKVWYRIEVSIAKAPLQSGAFFFFRCIILWMKKTIAFLIIIFLFFVGAQMFLDNQLI